MKEPAARYIIPPRLKTKITYFGFYVEELAVLFLFFFGGLMLKLYFSISLPLILSAVFVVLWLRPTSGRNVYSYIKLLGRYYAGAQVFTLKENRYEDEN